MNQQWLTVFRLEKVCLRLDPSITCAALLNNIDIALGSLKRNKGGHGRHHFTLIETLGVLIHHHYKLFVELVVKSFCVPVSGFPLWFSQTNPPWEK